MANTNCATSAQLAERLALCLVQPPPIDLRPRLAALLRGADRIELRYEWVKDWDAFNRLVLVEENGWELGDGQEWVILWRKSG